MYRIASLILIFLNLYIDNCSAQNARYYYSLTEKQGLGSNAVYSIHYSNSGYLYIGHNRGLDRYDGKEFQLYTGIDNEALHSIIEDDNGTIWCLNFKGQIYFLTKGSKKLELYTSKIPKSAYCSLHFIDHQILLVHNPQRAIYKIDHNKHSIILENAGGYMYKLFHIKNELYTSSANKNGINLININTKTITTHPYNDIINSKVGQFCALNIDDSIFYTNIEGKYLGSINQNGKFEKSQLLPAGHEAQCIDFTILQNRFLCYTSYDGIYIYSTKGKLLYHLLKGEQISRVIMLEDGSVICSSLNKGIFIIPFLDLKINSYQNSLHDSELIYKLVSLKSGDYIATNSAKLIKTSKNGQVKKISQLPLKADVQAFQYDSINKNIIAYTQGLYICDNKNLKIKKILQATSTKDVICINNKYFCATSRGIDIASKKIKAISILHKIWCYTLYFSSKDSLLYIGSKKGLHSYSLLSKEVKTYNTTDSLNIIKIHPWDKEHMLLQTQSKLLLLWNRTLNKVTNKLRLKKIPHFVVCKQQQIYILDAESFYKTNFESDAGTILSLPAIISGFSPKKFSLKDDGYLLYNNNSSLWVPAYYNEFEKEPYIKIQNIEGSFHQKDSIYVSDYFDNRLKIHFSILPAIRHNKNYIVTYRVKELQNEWVSINYLKNESIIQYLNLPNGRYTLEIRAQNSQGIQTAPLIFKFEITTPLHLQLWFIIFMIVILLLIMYLIFKWQLNRQKAKAKERLQNERIKRKLVDTELKAIRAQMNPHFMFNTLNSIQAMVLDSDKLLAYETISTFAQLMRNTLDYSAKEYIALSKEIQFIEDYVSLENTRLDRKIKFNLSVAPELSTETFQIPCLITQPFVENAIKHGLNHKKDGRVLDFIVSAIDKGYQIDIKDNGIGLEEAKRIKHQNRHHHQSFATKAIDERIKNINDNKKVRIEKSIQSSSEGTLISLQFKYKDKNAD